MLLLNASTMMNLNSTMNTCNTMSMNPMNDDNVMVTTPTYNANGVTLQLTSPTPGATIIAVPSKLAPSALVTPVLYQQQQPPA